MQQSVNLNQQFFMFELITKLTKQTYLTVCLLDRPFEAAIVPNTVCLRTIFLPYCF